MHLYRKVQMSNKHCSGNRLLYDPRWNNSSILFLEKLKHLAASYLSATRYHRCAWGGGGDRYPSPSAVFRSNYNIADATCALFCATLLECSIKILRRYPPGSGAKPSATALYDNFRQLFALGDSQKNGNHGC